MTVSHRSQVTLLGLLFRFAIVKVVFTGADSARVTFHLRRLNLICLSLLVVPCTTTSLIAAEVPVQKVALDENLLPPAPTDWNASKPR